MAEVIVAVADPAVLSHDAHKAVVSAYVFNHAVNDVEKSLDLALGQIYSRVQLVLFVRGRKAFFNYINHLLPPYTL